MTAAATFSLDGKVAIVTGAASGIGRGAVQAFAKAGAAVAVSDVNAAGAEQVAEQIRLAGGRAVVCPEALGTDDAGALIVSRTIDEFGQVDVLFNSAGIARTDNCWELSVEDFRRVQEINLVSVFSLCREAVGQSMLRRQSGKIINVTSRVALRGKPMEAAYAAAKMGVVGLTLQLATELQPYHINVNAISPAAWTAMAEALPDDARAAMRESRSKNVLGRVGEVEDLLPSLLFLASDASDYITGQIIHVNGEPTHLL